MSDEKNDWPSTVTAAPLPGDTVVCDWIATNARFLPDKLACVDVHSGRQHTYLQMDQRVAALAGDLAARGVEKGDRVAVLSLNSTDMLDIMHACWRVGAVFLPLNFRLTTDELSFILQDSSPRVLYLNEMFNDHRAALEAETDIAHWVSFDGAGGDTEFEQAISSASPVREMVPQGPDDLCLIMYSSGTTGRPKGVTLTHGNMAAAIFSGPPAIGTSRDMVGLCPMPLFHIGGLNGFSTSCLYYGGTTVLMREFDPGKMLELINDPAIGVTHIMGVPAIYNALRAHPDNAQTDFSRLVCALAGAEAVPEALLRWWLERGVVVQEVYGMTETCGGACFVPKSDIPDRIGSSGVAARYVQFRIADDSGCELPRGEKGEILMRGLIVTPGYWNRPDANKETIIGGWLRSGDVGRMDEQGYVYVEDRVKDMYISGGENVYPAEVENVLYELDQIAEVAVIGIPDEKWGEVGCAVTVLKEGASLTHEELITHCAGKLAKYKYPAYLEFLEILPRNATGKVLKFQLRQTIPDRLKQA